MILGLERVVPPQDVGGLTQRQPKVGPVEGDVAEPHEGPARRLLRAQPLRVGLQPGEWHPRLDAALHRDERKLHVDRARQVRLVDPELFELGDFTRFRTRWPRRLGKGRLGFVGHAVIVPGDRRLAAGDWLGPRRSIMLSMPPRKKPRSVLIIGSEAVPFAKTGGLADVLGALPSALARLGWDVTLALPRYRGVHGGSLAAHFPVTVGGLRREVAFFEAALASGARVWFVDCPELFDRDGIYGLASGDYPDNARRFAVLVRAAFEFAATRGARPSVVHAHDWQAGLAPVYLRTLYATHPVLGGVPSVLTIHNLAYQGLFDADWLPRLDLGPELLSIDRLEYWGRISFLKGGINDAEAVTTVSRRYAEEIQTPEFGCGFDGILRRRRADLTGVLNGIDLERWNPEHDPFLPGPYNADDLSGKAAAKAELLTRYRLKTDETTLKRPVVGIISRMIDQKGFDLMAALVDDLPRLEATFIVLGTGETR